jgi:hypothetical protein
MAIRMTVSFLDSHSWVLPGGSTVRLNVMALPMWQCAIYSPGR